MTPCTSVDTADGADTQLAGDVKINATSPRNLAPIIAPDTAAR